MIAPRRSVRGFSIVELLVVLATGAVLMAIGTPVLRGALNEQRLSSAAIDLSSAISEARRQAVRTSEQTRVEVDPADGRISVFAVNTATNVEIETRRTYLPNTVVFDTLMIITNYNFNSLGRPATLPMVIGLRANTTGVVKTVTVEGSGQTNIN